VKAAQTDEAAWRGGGTTRFARARLSQVSLLRCCAAVAHAPRSRIEPERLSLLRLKRESAAVGGEDHVLVCDVYARFGVRLLNLLCVIQGLQLPADFCLHGRHVVSGWKAGLITLRRQTTAGDCAAFLLPIMVVFAMLTPLLLPCAHTQCGSLSMQVRAK